MLGWLLRLLLIFLLFRAIWRLLSGVFEGMQVRPPQRQPDEVRLVRDPVCGTFVVPTKALTEGHGSDMKYFCSERCRNLYRNSTDRDPRRAT